MRRATPACSQRRPALQAGTRLAVERRLVQATAVRRSHSSCLYYDSISIFTYLLYLLNTTTTQQLSSQQLSCNCSRLKFTLLLCREFVCSQHNHSTTTPQHYTLNVLKNVVLLLRCRCDVVVLWIRCCCCVECCGFFVRELALTGHRKLKNFWLRYCMPKTSGQSQTPRTTVTQA